MKTDAVKNHALVGIIIISFIVGGANGALALDGNDDTIDPPSGHTSLVIKAIMVTDDLILRPIPKKRFLIKNDNTDSSVITGFDGEAHIVLQAGRYRIVSDQPLEFDGSSYSWDIEIEVTTNSETVVELSNHNATTQPIAGASAKDEVVLDEGSLYRVIKDGVVKIMAEGGHGSGFIVDPQGLILTNHHVVSDSDFLAVKVDDTHKYQAKLIAEDNLNDLAVVRINPSAIEGLPIMKLADDRPDDPPVSVGERVLAIGSPLATETILTLGIVSKVEQGAIYSDVSINPGNSGGPLFSMRGEVVGVNTFGLTTSSGPGVSGIVRIHLAKDLVARSQLLINSQDPPNARLLPVESSYRFPADRLRDAALSSSYNPKKYHVESGKIDVQFITPVVIAKLQVDDEIAAAQRQKKRSKKSKNKAYQPGKDFYNWRQYAGDYRAVVTIQAIPEIKLTGGSMFAVIMVGNSAHRAYRFKTDFHQMELTRDGTLVEPIHPGRTKTVVSQRARMESFEDVGVYGRYSYPPEAFRPGADLVLKVWNTDKEEPRIEPLSEELVSKIWSDFKPYFEALEEKVSG